ncbi:MAG: hypothetical protein IT184_08870 [Acidobacteria bacterium]|nr:hypothetical protein [Acidobacteriota bacterium]
MAAVRVAAARVLLSVERGHATLAAALDRERAAVADARDRGLLVELAAGALRWQAELDALTEAAARRPAAHLDAPVRVVLRLGAYQLRHLERVPPHAIVHEAVEAVRTLGAPRAAGLVNAVLRQMARDPDAARPRAGAALPRRPGPTATEEEQLAYLAVALSHPRWVVQRWLRRYGFDATERWCRFNNASPAVTVRPLGGRPVLDRLAALRTEGIEAERAPYAAGAIRLPPGSLGRLTPATAETMAVQDEGAQLVAEFAGARPGETVIDLCAAPGGKTTALADDLELTRPGSRSHLIASDYRVSRVRLLARTMAERGLPVPVVALDARQPLPFRPIFDCVVLDAPCSGLGTLRRDPDLKWIRREDDQPRFVADERRMLRAAAALVRPGGRLVYATCSSEPEENIEVVRAFLAEVDGFELAPPPARLPADVVDADGCLRTEPFRHALDAYFAATLVRRGGA